MRRLIIILFIITCSNSIFAKELNFYKEIITITIFGDYCELEGDYYFRNTDSISTILVYPFVINDSLSFPDSIRIADKNGMMIPHKNTESGVMFPFKKSDFFKGYYYQKTKHNYFEYILTSTQTWGKPLEEMDFIIKVSNDLELIDLSLSYNKIEKNNDFTIYYISRKNYMPMTNMIIEWK